MDRHIISAVSTVMQALEQLNKLSGDVMTLFAVDSNGAMVGTLTDGDVRRGLLRGSQLTDPIEKVVNRHFYSVNANPSPQEIKRIRALGIRLLPLLDTCGHIERIIDLTKIKTLLPLTAILMAGGKGERLRPLTLTTPKPLLKIGDRAIIDYNIEALTRVGITDVTVTTGYLAEQIDQHFAQPVCGINVKTVREDTPLGTIGAASLVQRNDPNGATLVMNSDLLTTASIEEMYLKHIDEKADITIAAIPYAVSVPYAILTTDGPKVTGLEEKPSYSYYANAGIYIIANHLLNTLPTDRRTDATELIESAIANGNKVVYFPINGTWIDIGSPTDFKQAQELMHHAMHLNTPTI